MHPCWEERDQELMRDYVAASVEFEHRWQEWYASPGGDPPIIVFMETPTVRKVGSNQLQVRVPMRCENLAGALEVVFRLNAVWETTERLDFQQPSGFEMRELTGCTSPRTTVTFYLADSSGKKPNSSSADVNVLDDRGRVLARAAIPTLPR